MTVYNKRIDISLVVRGFRVLIGLWLTSWLTSFPYGVSFVAIVLSSSDGAGVMLFFCFSNASVNMATTAG